ncbi:MAG: type I DNA topoisomerase [Patescibacteria group bacterium]
MNLVIVESPTKAKTISKFLGKKYKIESSYGHVRDLPKSKLGIDIEHNFEPHYIIPVRARKNVNALKKLAAKADKIILATDEDREGEAIAWHLTQALGLDPNKNNIERIVFHEITESALQHALLSPRNIDINRVNAQQARRILDRLVGYELSPFLWKKIIRGLSAGRVQSVALRLIVEREEEIKKFKADEYWTIDVDLEAKKGKFIASLNKINGESITKLGIKNKEEADKIGDSLKNSEFKINEIIKKEVRKNPLPPFITSTLQQEGSKKLYWSAKQTMMFAQRLYENGLITYMRTDSVNLSQGSLDAARVTIEKEFGKKYLIDEPRIFKTKSRLAQEAHEAIRPADPAKTPDEITVEDPKEKKLYELIWRRFISTQMPQAIFDATSVGVTAESKDKNYELRANGNILKFDGFLKAWPQKFEEHELPELKENETLKLDEIKPEQHFTEPPPRYNEASLIKTLESFDIGRPSTYAPTLSVIQTRNYVQKNEARRFEPTEIGTLVNKVLTEHFPQIVDIQFTAKMEEQLDNVAEGKEKWQRLIGDFYGPFADNLKKKYEEVPDKIAPPPETTDEVCDCTGKNSSPKSKCVHDDLCGKPMVIKTGRFGKFLACSGFPNCKNAKSLKKNVGIENEKGERIKCSKCGEGEIVRKRTKRARFFYGCTRYPDCDFASWTKPTGEKKEEGEEEPEVETKEENEETAE